MFWSVLGAAHPLARRTRIVMRCIVMRCIVMRRIVMRPQPRFAPNAN